MPRREDQFQTVRSEGAILPPDLLQRISAGEVAGLDAATYHLPSGTKTKEAISQAWTQLLKYWRDFKAPRETLPKSDETGTAITNDKWLLPLFQELGYGRLTTTKSPEIADKVYPIERFWTHVPIHLIGFKLSLDHRTKGARGAATAIPHSMVQEFLNRSSGHMWAFLSNGLQLRILRDNAALSRQAYVEFDLESMMDGEVYADFALLWLICHQSRLEADKPENCWLEKWSKSAQEQGTRMLNDLRLGVAKAIELLGRGFIAHPANGELLEKLQSGKLSRDDYYRQILRIVYRLLFLFVAEDRGLLHPLPPQDAPNASCLRRPRQTTTASIRLGGFATWRRATAAQSTLTSGMDFRLSSTLSAAMKDVPPSLYRRSALSSGRRLQYRISPDRNRTATLSTRRRCSSATKIYLTRCEHWRSSKRVRYCGLLIIGISVVRSLGRSTNRYWSCVPTSTYPAVHLRCQRRAVTSERPVARTTPLILWCNVCWIPR